ncbi:PEP-CTERM sorting domain-containing protein [Bradyrhizobium lablabi]|uniref:PEP-CTERM sorting domain-containing protein n=1 Tax=Bradyrhizobium lablabi TaxID=722472 RepID=UPI001BA7DCAD|nr:PEP-CTERM sorting domain-containing protein [Bradyrhizobium lablabi]MBR0697811.1 PEP-CTERM sorting domain-containing protein [Bradyrhizobium lablabi]
MPWKSCFVVSCLTLGIGLTSASAATVAVDSYDMNNGNGTIQNGAFNYFDTTYNGSGNPNANGSSLVVPSNGSAQESLLSGGTGKLTDGTIASQNFSISHDQYVGWKYQDPTIVFHLEPGKSVSSVSLYVASSFAASLGMGGLVAAPSSVGVSLSNNGSIFTPTYTTSFSDYLNDPYTNTEVITLTFATPVSSEDVFSLTLNRGKLQLDGINYYNNHVAQNGCDASGCFLDNVNDFKHSAYDPNLEPWIMLSEVEFTAAVPEPSTWIMLVLGFAGLGFVASRRRKEPTLRTV